MNRRLNFGGAGSDPFGERNPRSIPSALNPMRVLDLENAYYPPPIPPEYRAPPPQVHPTQIIEPTQGWWRQEGAFGNRFEGRPPTTAETLIPLFEQQNLPGPPKPWWLHWYRFDRSISNELVSLGNWELRARIIYGVGGVQNIIETDLIQGLQYPIVCNSISVQLRTYATLDTSPYIVAADARVVAGCMLGEGAGSAAVPPSFTTQWFEKAGATDARIYPVPDFARSLCVHTDATDSAELDGIVITFRSGGGDPLKELVLGDLYDALTREKGVAIPAGVNQIEINAGAAVDPGRYIAVQFFLAL